MWTNQRVPPYKGEQSGTATGEGDRGGMSAETVIPHSTQEDTGKGKKRARETSLPGRQTRALVAATGYHPARDWKLVPPSAPRQDKPLSLTQQQPNQPYIHVKSDRIKSESKSNKANRSQNGNHHGYEAGSQQGSEEPEAPPKRARN